MAYPVIKLLHYEPPRIMNEVADRNMRIISRISSIHERPKLAVSCMVRRMVMFHVSEDL